MGNLKKQIYEYYQTIINKHYLKYINELYNLVENSIFLYDNLKVSSENFNQSL